eukprot:2598243-Amphidinium_carterae.1
MIQITKDVYKSQRDSGHRPYMGLPFFTLAVDYHSLMCLASEAERDALREQLEREHQRVEDLARMAEA